MNSKRKELEVVAKELLEKEIIFQSDLERLIGKRPFAAHTTYQAFTNANGSVEDQEKESGEKEAEAKNAKNIASKKSEEVEPKLNEPTDLTEEN